MTQPSRTVRLAVVLVAIVVVVLAIRRVAPVLTETSVPTSASA